MRKERRSTLLLLAVVLLAGCAMARHREQVRQGLLTRGLHRNAFLKEWGPPTRTFSLPADDPVLRARPFVGPSWERVVYEVWEYQDRATCLVFDGVRLVSWETGRSDCTPRPRRERTERQRPAPRPQPYPPYPSDR